MAKQKTAIMPMNKKGLPPDYMITVGPTAVKPTKNLKHLGVILDNGYCFYEHVLNITNKTIRIMAALSRIMPNMINILKKQQEAI